MAIATHLNDTSDMLRRLIERQKTPTVGTGEPNVTGDPQPPTAPTGTNVGTVTPRPPTIDPGFWNQPEISVAPPTGTAPGAPGTTPVPTTTPFGPGNNLIGEQINLPDTSREELVQRMFNAVTPEMDRQAGLRREDLSRRIAGLGRAGMGGVNTSFGNLEALESQRRSELLGKLAAEGASGDISDMFKRAGFLQDERGYQHGLDREGIRDQQIQAALLQQLGFGFDPLQSGNLTNSLLGGANTAAQSANASGGFWGNLGNIGSNILVNSI